MTPALPSCGARWPGGQPHPRPGGQHHGQPQGPSSGALRPRTGPPASHCHLSAPARRSIVDTGMTPGVRCARTARSDPVPRRPVLSSRRAPRGAWKSSMRVTTLGSLPRPHACPFCQILTCGPCIVPPFFRRTFLED